MKKLFAIPGNGVVIILGKKKDAATSFCFLCAMIVFGLYLLLLLANV